MGSWLSHPPLPSHHMLWISIIVKLTHLFLEKIIKISNFDVILTVRILFGAKAQRIKGVKPKEPNTMHL